MVRTIRARYDGKVIIPEEPVEIPVNQSFHVQLVLPDPDVPAISIEDRRAALERFLANPIHGLNLPESALTRESIYGED